MAGQSAGSSRSFPSTQWTVLGLIAQGEDDQAQTLLEDLLRRYWPALKRHLVVRRRIPADLVEDLLHDFVERKIMRGFLEKADRTRGRFRTFLLTSLERFVISQRPRYNSIPTAQTLEPPAPEQPGADPFELDWARQILAAAQERMREECRSKHRDDLWLVFEGRILNPCLNGAEPVAYEQLVAQGEYHSPSETYNALATAKRMFVRQLEAVVGEYCADESEVQEEIGDLWRIVSRAGATSP